MLVKYIYKDRRTGQKVFTNNKKDDDVNFELIQEVKGREDFNNLIIKQCIAKKVM